MTIRKKARILTMVSCERMHDHGAMSALWTWSDDDPFALSIHPEGTDVTWQVDRLQFCDAVNELVPGVPVECGVASLQLRRSMPAALSLRMSRISAAGPEVTYLICSVYDVMRYLATVAVVAPDSFDSCVNETLQLILGQN